MGKKKNSINLSDMNIDKEQGQMHDFDQGTITRL
jgi:hypothetical protein